MIKIFFNSIIILITILLPAFSTAQQSTIFFDSTWFGFNTGTSIKVGFPYTSKLADMDNDGDSDVVSCQRSFANGFTFMKNPGDGHFVESGHYNSPKAGYDILAHDFNNDGKKDVVTCNYGFYFGDGTTISMYLNLGNGIFSLGIQYPSGLAPAGLASGDLNLDGWLDVVVNNYKNGASTVSVLLNNGNGTFASPLTFPAGLNAWRVRVGKINEDNLPDIIVGNGNRVVSVLYNSGGNNFSDKVEYVIEPGGTGGGELSTVAIEDINNDGKLDIFYSPGLRVHGNNPHGSIAMLKNMGNRNFAPVEFLAQVSYTLASPDIEFADLNLDGWKDIAVASYNGRNVDGYMVFMSNGNGGFHPSFLNNAGQYTTDLMIGDADLDGKIDILSTDHSTFMVSFHKNYGNGYFPVPKIVTTNSIIAGFHDAADIDADGDLDVFTSGSGSAGGDSEPAILKNYGNGTFTPGVIYSIRNGGVQGKLRDLNGDGRPDLLFATSATSFPYDFHFALNNGDGTFGAIQTKQLGSCGWFDIDAADFDNDGDLDVVLTEHLACPGTPNSGRRIYICLNNGNAVFANPIIKLSTSPFPGAVEIKDFNRDGNLDLATAHRLSIDIHLGLGNGDFMQSVVYPTDPRTFDLVGSDFNNDNIWDLASCHQGDSESVNVMLGNGNGTFQPKQYYFAPGSFDLRNHSGIAAGDVDSDGDKDIILAGSASNTMSIYLNTGNGTSFTFKTRYGAHLGASAPFFADFNADGRADLAYLGSSPPGGVPSVLAVMRGRTTEFITTQRKLNLTSLIQGFYNSTLNKMVPDTMTVYLRNVNSPYSIVDSSKSLLDTTGKGTFNFSNAANGVSYYIVIKHRNSIETWSSAGISFLHEQLNYNFTTSSSQAYGNNQVQVDISPVRFAIYSGDVNQDGIIDASDNSLIDNDAYNSVSGYVVTDLNGDNFVDATDLSVADNNTANSIIIIRP